MQYYVVDASVAVKWFLQQSPDEGNVAEALQLLTSGMSGEMTFVQPSHWVAEIASVLARCLPEQLANDNIADLLLLDCVKPVDAIGVYQRAVSLSQTLNHHLFDTLYHAVALEADTTLITADLRYYTLAKNLGGIVMLEDFSTPQS